MVGFKRSKTRFRFLIYIIVILIIILFLILVVRPQFNNYLIQRDIESKEELGQLILDITKARGYVVVGNQTDWVVLVPVPPETIEGMQNG